MPEKKKKPIGETKKGERVFRPVRPPSPKPPQPKPKPKK